MNAIERLIRNAKIGRFGENWVGTGEDAEHLYLGYEKPMPCGHKARYAYTPDEKEGTTFCALCELYAGYSKEAFVLDNGG